MWRRLSKKPFPGNPDVTGVGHPRSAAFWLLAASCALGIPPVGAQTGAPTLVPPPAAALAAAEPSGHAYVPGARRDPFMPVMERLRQAGRDRPPLQRVPLGSLTVTGVIWGGFGSKAVVQTSDGKGYTLQPGSLVGPNNGVVTAISEDTITILERVTDQQGRRLVRKHVAALGANFAEVDDRTFRAGLPAEMPAMAEGAPAVGDLSRPARSVHLAALSNTMAAALDSGVPPAPPGPYSYNPLGRRDPFAPVLREAGTSREADIALPPLQRVTLTEVTLIGVIWGGFGYSAMVQTPDGKGYTVNRGTVIGPNNGVVTAISESGITVEERFTDLYGKKLVREHVIPLRGKERTE